MRRRMITVVALALTASLALFGCGPDEKDGGGDGTGGDTNGTTTMDGGGSATGGDDAGGTGGDDAGSTTGDDAGGTTGDDAGGDDAGGTGGDTGVDGGGDGGTPDDFVWKWKTDCPASTKAEYAAAVGVGGGSNEYTTAKSTADGDSGGNVTVETGDWILFTWNGGSHTVTGDKWEGADQSAKCGTDDTAWFDSTSKSSGYGCLQINKTGTFWYQCTVASHCENGMNAKVTVQ